MLTASGRLLIDLEGARVELLRVGEVPMPDRAFLPIAKAYEALAKAMDALVVPLVDAIVEEAVAENRRAASPREDVGERA